MTVVRTPDYWRAYRRRWRSTHRAAENARKARFRAIPGWRAAHEPERRQAVAPIPLPPLHDPAAHPLFAEAWRLIPSVSPLTVFADPLPEDLRSEVVLALLEGRDPLAAATRYRRIERAWGYRTCVLAEER